MLRKLSWEEYGRHDYLPRAIVDVAVAESERNHRVAFEADVDDLGEVLWCPVVLGSGAPIPLSRHIGLPDEVELAATLDEDSGNQGELQFVGDLPGGLHQLPQLQST